MYVTILKKKIGNIYISRHHIIDMLILVINYLYSYCK